jgi:hypothetical protein
VEALADQAVRSRLVDLGYEVYPRERQTPEGDAANPKSKIQKSKIAKTQKSKTRISDFAEKEEEKLKVQKIARTALKPVREHRKSLPAGGFPMPPLAAS